MKISIIIWMIFQAGVVLGQHLEIAEKAMEQVGKTLVYDPAYVKLDYPNGDVPLRSGVCTDVVIRALRGIGVDLQKQVHEDMRKNFQVYPKDWGLRKPDKNIDHRRVPNLMKFFERRKMTVKTKAMMPGDIFAWRLAGGRLHIGVASDRLNETRNRFMVVHNIGSGAKLEDVFAAYTLIGHYRVDLNDWVGVGSGKKE